MKNNDRSFEHFVNVEAARRASYFGLEVEVVTTMTHCSSIRYRDEEFVVLTEDLQSLGDRCCAAAA
jgi:hypothetical protein